MKHTVTKIPCQVILRMPVVFLNCFASCEYSNVRRNILEHVCLENLKFRSYFNSANIVGEAGGVFWGSLSGSLRSWLGFFFGAKAKAGYCKCNSILLCNTPYLLQLLDSCFHWNACCLFLPAEICLGGYNFSHALANICCG